jgi:hypothetical protein
MKSILTRLSLYLVMILVLLGTFLSGCSQVENNPLSTQTINNHDNNPTRTSEYENQTPIIQSRVKMADSLSSCQNGVDAISPDAVWATAYCGPDGEEEVWKIGENQSTTLYKLKPARGYLTFSPDSKMLLVAIQQGPLWLYEVGQWGSPKVLYPQLPAYAMPTWSPDSQSIAISYLEKGQALSIIKLDGTYRNLIALQDVNSEYENYGVNMFGPTWSPDSSKIAYVIAKNMANPPPIQLWTVDVASGKKELLYSGKSGEVAYRPEWSPDGSKILVINRESARNNNMYIFNINEKTFSLLYKYIDPFPTLWSPDSKDIAVCDNNKLYLLNIEINKSSLVSPSCDIIQWKDDHHIITQDYLNLDFYLVSLP